MTSTHTITTNNTDSHFFNTWYFADGNIIFEHDFGTPTLANLNTFIRKVRDRTNTEAAAAEHASLVRLVGREFTHISFYPNTPAHFIHAIRNDFTTYAVLLDNASRYIAGDEVRFPVFETETNIAVRAHTFREGEDVVPQHDDRLIGIHNWENNLTGTDTIATDTTDTTLTAEQRKAQENAITATRNMFNGFKRSSGGEKMRILTSGTARASKPILQAGSMTAAMDIAGRINRTIGGQRPAIVAAEGGFPRFEFTRLSRRCTDYINDTLVQRPADNVAWLPPPPAVFSEDVLQIIEADYLQDVAGATGAGSDTGDLRTDNACGALLYDLLPAEWATGLKANGIDWEPTGEGE